MRTWEDFEKEAKKISPQVASDIEELEILASIISAIIIQRTKLGYSQRDLAKICGIPQSSVARIEGCSVKPNVETLLKIMKPLGLTLKVSAI